MASLKGEEATSSIPSEGEFLKAFMRMENMEDELYQYVTYISCQHYVMKSKYQCFP